MLTTKYPWMIRCKKCRSPMDVNGKPRYDAKIRVSVNGKVEEITEKVKEDCDHEAQTIEQSCAERYRRRPENLEGLSKDLDGDYYVVNETFPEGWKVTPCCGSLIKAVEGGIVCRSCFEPMDDFHDAPARLLESQEPSLPAWLTTRTIKLPQP